MEPKTKKVIVGFAVGIPLAIVLITLLLWPLSSSIRESTYIAFLNSHVPPLTRKAMKELRNYHSKDSIMALIKYLNEVDPTDEGERRWAVPGLESLILLTKQDFGTDYYKSPNGEWHPPITETEWRDTIKIINMWATEKYGPEEMKKQDLKPAPGYKEWYQRTYGPPGAGQPRTGTGGGGEPGGGGSPQAGEPGRRRGTYFYGPGSGDGGGNNYGNYDYDPSGRVYQYDHQRHRLERSYENPYRYDRSFQYEYDENDADEREEPWWRHEYDNDAPDYPPYNPNDYPEDYYYDEYQDR